MGQYVLRPLRRHGWLAGARLAGDQSDQRRRFAVHRCLHAGHPRRQAGLGGAQRAGTRRHQRPGPGHQPVDQGTAVRRRGRDDLARRAGRNLSGAMGFDPRYDGRTVGRGLRRSDRHLRHHPSRLRHRGSCGRRPGLDRAEQPGIEAAAAIQASGSGVVHAAGAADRVDRRRPQSGRLGAQGGRQAGRGQRDGHGLRRVRRPDVGSGRQDHGCLRDRFRRSHLCPADQALQRVRPDLQLQPVGRHADAGGQRHHQ